MVKEGYVRHNLNKHLQKSETCSNVLQHTLDPMKHRSIGLCSRKHLKIIIKTIFFTNVYLCKIIQRLTWIYTVFHITVQEVIYKKEKSVSISDIGRQIAEYGIEISAIREII